MTSLQKFAWYNLGIISLTGLAVAVGYPIMGSPALGFLGILGFLGFGPLFFLKRGGKVIFDERDRLIQFRASTIAYSIFWVIFVMVCVFGTSTIYGENGDVPVTVVRLSVFWALMLVYLVQSIAILVQYARDGRGDA